MAASDEAIASWLGSLTDGGVLSASAHAGRAIAAYALGEEALRRLRSAFDPLPAPAARTEKIAALETCLWMASVDRSIAGEERALLVEMINCSGLSSEDRADLEAAIGSRPAIAGLERRIGTYELRELLLAMCWQLAQADGRIDVAEASFYVGLASKLGVREARAVEIRRAMDAKVGRHEK